MLLCEVRPGWHVERVPTRFGIKIPVPRSKHFEPIDLHDGVARIQKEEWHTLEDNRSLEKHKIEVLVRDGRVSIMPCQVGCCLYRGVNYSVSVNEVNKDTRTSRILRCVD